MVGKNTWPRDSEMLLIQEIKKRDLSYEIHSTLIQRPKKSNIFFHFFFQILHILKEIFFSLILMPYSLDSSRRQMANVID